MIRRLRIKLILAAGISLFIVLTVIMGCAAIFNFQSVVSEADQTLALLSENNGSFPSMQRPQKNAPGPPRQMSPELPYESRYFSVLLDQEGDIISTNVGKIAAVDASEAAVYAQTVLEGGRERGFLDHYRYLVYTTERETHIIFLDCGRSLGNFRTFLLTSIAMSAAGLFAVLLLLVFLSRHIVKPFSDNYEKQKRFITDAGHELKTPLTIIDADAEVLEMDYGENEWLRDIQLQTKRLAELTNSLILLARMEEEHPKTELVDFPLSDMVEETLDGFQALARTRGRRLDSSIQPMLSFCGDEKALRRLVTILLDNAIKYANDGGRISLQLEQKKNTIYLRVFNTAESVPRDALNHLFDRFYRMDQSRNSQTGGYGLGLSIAAAIVNLHKGKISASTQDEHSLLITVALPA